MLVTGVRTMERVLAIVSKLPKQLLYLCFGRHTCLVHTNESKVSITIYQILNNELVICWSWGEDVHCTDNAVNETKFILSL